MLRSEPASLRRCLDGGLKARVWQFKQALANLAAVGSRKQHALSVGGPSSPLPPPTRIGYSAHILIGKRRSAAIGSSMRERRPWAPPPDRFRFASARTL